VLEHACYGAIERLNLTAVKTGGISCAAKMICLPANFQDIGRNSAWGVAASSTVSLGRTKSEIEEEEEEEGKEERKRERESGDRVRRDKFKTMSMLDAINRSTESGEPPRE
jgi:hypothetical protein